MQYAFKVTANRNIGGSKGIVKGMTVQISKEDAALNINDILAAYDRQLGIKITGISVTTRAFAIQKLYPTFDVACKECKAVPFDKFKKEWLRQLNNRYR
ncbi:MAG: hypothetical protein HDS97_07875 [Bacteroidales bacterium]|nr:hypothetical protein [Bacteroidales bacterium]